MGDTPARGAVAEAVVMPGEVTFEIGIGDIKVYPRAAVDTCPVSGGVMTLCYCVEKEYGVIDGKGHAAGVGYGIYAAPLAGSCGPVMFKVTVIEHGVAALHINGTADSCFIIMEVTVINYG